MKRILLLALPWMAMATVATGQVRQAHVSYSYFGPLKSPAYRLADECFLPVSSLKEIGWTATVDGAKAEVVADGSHITIPVRAVAGHECIPLCRAIDELGGEAFWNDKDPDRLSVVAIVQSIVLANGRLKIDASMNVKPQISMQEDPSRVVIDIPGAKLKKTGVFQLDSKSSLGMAKPDEVRLVWQSDRLPETPSSLGPARGVDLQLYSPKAEPAPQPIKHPDSEKPDTPVTGAPQTGPIDEASVATPAGPGNRVKLNVPLERPNHPGATVTPEAVPLKPLVPVGPPQLTVESQDDLTLSMALNSPLPSSPRVARPDPNTIEITLPNADLKLSPDFKLDTQSVTSVSTQKVGPSSILTLKTARPMGAEVVTNGTMVHLHLLKPRVGNGKLAGKVIVVDPGHGGRDTGCFSPDHTLFEKDLTLSMGKLVAKRLAEDGATVILTRKTDYLTPLTERPQIANRNGADFFISIHINSLSIDNKVSGTRTYYHSNNRISQLLGDCLQSEIIKVSGLPSQGVQSDTSLYSSGKGLSVLRGMEKNIPAVLIEVGFINHDRDRAAMVQPEFQLSFALAVERGLKVYLGDVKTKN